ncbi:SDR family oxidoreductase [Bosea sp. NPDC055353]
MPFDNQTVSVVVGGASGIGKAVAKTLSQRPGRVEIAGRKAGLDIADPAAVESWFERLGPVDHVVVTAGSQAPGGKVTDVSLEAAKAAFDVKFWGSLAVARAAAKHIRPGGTVTLTSGFLARHTVPGTFVKTAMNAALEAAEKIIDDGLADVVCFARPFIANPDLPRRFRENLPLAAFDGTTLFGGDERGYSTYPAWSAAA